MEQQIKVRFAPSPTGPLHIGGARSALFNWLLARSLGGKMVVRIEDTDLERSSRESEKNILDSLRWLGIDWDEGIEVGGEFGPYRQTERLDTYKEATNKLLEKGLAYKCYCSEEEIQQEREELMAKGELPRYRGKCRSLSSEAEKKCLEEGRKHVVRFKVPENIDINIKDLVRGLVTFESNGIGDFVIVKSDGIPTYNFAVVLDDALMNITHVVRGEEHLSNTPRQILLYDALGLQAPKFAHVSLILGQDRSKMSKRHGSTAVEQYRAKGYLPDALMNFLALLGWSPVGEEEIFSLDELVKQFSLDRVAKNPAVFDVDKLNWLNGCYIRKAPIAQITDMAIPFLQQAGYIDGEIDEAKYAWIKMLVLAVQEKISYMAEILEHAKLFFEEEFEFESEEAKEVLNQEEITLVMNTFKQKIAELDEITVDNTKVILKAITKELKLGGKKVYMPVRVALTGQMHGPELFYIIPLLGKEKIFSRIDRTLAML